MRGQKDLRSMKRVSIVSKFKEEIDVKCLKTVKYYILVKNSTNFRSKYIWN